MKIPLRKGNPRAKVSGTSYKAQGQTDIVLTPDDYNELGSATRTNLFETVPEFTSRTIEQQTYTKMYRNSVSVRMGIRAGEAPVVGGDYYVEPFSTDPTDQLISEFVKFNLFDASTVPFKRTIRQICNGQYKAGTKVMEKVWELREWVPTINAPGANRKQYTVLRKLAPRPNETISQIQYDDNGGPVAVIQNSIDGKTNNTKLVTLPIEKVAIFPFEEEDGDLLGTSILRPAFMHYTFLEPLYKIDGIQKERHAIGIPDIKLHAGYSKSDKDLAHVIGRNLRANERAYVVSTDKFDVSFIPLEGQILNALESADFHDTMILKSLMLQFLNMGVTSSSGGGRATGATALDMFMKSMRYVGESICDSFNAYIIPQIVAFNFDTDRFPKLKVRNIGEAKDLQMWSSAMSNLIGKGVIEVDEDTENFVRAQVDFPKRTTPRSKIVTTNVEDIYNETPEQADGTAPAAPVPGTNTSLPAGTPADKSTGTGHPNGTGNVGKSASSGAV